MHDSINTNINNCTETGERPAITIMEIIDVTMDSHDLYDGTKKYDIGVFADIEPNENVNAAKVFLAVINKYHLAKCQDSLEKAFNVLDAFITINRLQDLKVVDLLAAVKVMARVNKKGIGEQIEMLANKHKDLIEH